MLTIIADGGGQVDVKPTYGSFKIFRTGELLHHIRIDYNTNDTNSWSEYKIIYDALKFVQEQYPNEKRLLIQNDSELIRNQVGVYQNGEWSGWKCNFTHLQIYRDVIRKLLEEYDFTWQHKPRRYIVSHLGH